MRPFYQIEEYKKCRWIHNLSLMFFNSILVNIFLTFSAAIIAFWAEGESIGLLNKLELPFVIKIILGLIILDFAIYTQHLLFHKMPILWRIHRVHHADINFDLTTALRFHPIEMILSMTIKMIIIYYLGISAFCFLLFEIILNGMAMFNHSNITLPSFADHLLRFFIVTPDMHRIHHSINAKDFNSNFGFNMSFWDRLFRTYREQPIESLHEIKIGLCSFKNPKYQKLHWILAIPFVNTDKLDKKITELSKENI